MNDNLNVLAYIRHAASSYEREIKIQKQFATIIVLPRRDFVAIISSEYIFPVLIRSLFIQLNAFPALTLSVFTD